jgi:hypothetical protein
MYTGFIYNDCFSKPVSFMPSTYELSVTHLCADPLQLVLASLCQRYPRRHSGECGFQFLACILPWR